MNSLEQYSPLLPKVNPQLPTRAVQVIIVTKPMDGVRHRVGMGPKANQEKTA
jgi:hypothetical protein